MNSNARIICINSENVNGENGQVDVLVHSTDVFTCGICEHNEENLIDFLKHKIQHQGPGNCYVCQLCKISYTKDSSLIQHYKVKHKVSLVPRKKRRNNFHEKEDIQDITNIIEEKGNDYDLQIVNMENLDVVSLLTSEGSDNSKCDPSYEKDSKTDGPQTVTPDCDIINYCEEIPASVTVNTAIEDSLPMDQSDGTTEIGHLDLKSDNDLSLSYTGPVAIKDNQEIVQTNSSHEENSVVTCNIEIISLDEPNNDLFIDDDESQERNLKYENDDKTDENDFFFCVKTNLNAGKTIIYERQNLCCIYCNYQDMVLANLYQHMSDQHLDHMNTKEELKLENTNDNIKLMKFSEYKRICLKYHMGSSRKNRNTEMQDQAGEFPCSKCDKIFTRLRYLKKHITLHKPEKPFLCDFCGKSFKTQTYLTIHHRSHSKKSYECEQCDFSSSNTALIHIHRQQHNNGCVLCDICGNAYSDKSTLTKHKRVHDPNRPYQCNYPGCTWRFLTEVMCRAHQRNHDTEGKFKCSHCGYVFRHKHHVKRHEAQVHGIKNQPIKIDDKTDSGLEPSSMNNIQSINEVKNTNELQEKDTSTVNVIVESTEESTCLQESVSGGQLVITTDTEGNALNYQLTEISNIALMDSGGGRTIIIPQIDYGNVVLQRVENAVGDSPMIKVTELKENI
ncbi:uncharacterized protein LOC143079680 [Mytilus galloprovincialis]|uniref:uncharacterized protein LOC143079680 n=1 Tax=Mytilus galloprovincialis TaxID=29158 RepID=UPI003F7B9852